jgi:hypothetical protein
MHFNIFFLFPDELKSTNSCSQSVQGTVVIHQARRSSWSAASSFWSPLAFFFILYRVLAKVISMTEQFEMVVREAIEKHNESKSFRINQAILKSCVIQ